ncbi:class I SAM-dependent methyltransferase [Candidatus Curtissbacteria bacterium]|nr:class I SAM-dependent methyltransferase [Candidatus Curtissbacteria bacterium]
MSKSITKITTKSKDFFVNFVIKSFAKYFWRQHPETALRYLPVVRELKKAHLEDSKILEVGSGSLGITPYLKRKIDGLDIDFSGPPSPLINKIKGEADNLPFRKNSYEVVVSVDVIEHLEKNRREKAIFETLRVVKKLALIVLPVGENSEKQDRKLHFYWQKIFKEKNQYLLEHVENGLPKINEILVLIDKSLRKLGKIGKVSSSPILNLQVRNILMRTWITKNKFIYYLYLKGYLLLIPFLKFANFGNCYRRIFIIELANR